jgi:hypothetical protein
MDTSYATTKEYKKIRLENIAYSCSKIRLGCKDLLVIISELSEKDTENIEDSMNEILNQLNECLDFARDVRDDES